MNLDKLNSMCSSFFFFFHLTNGDNKPTSTDTVRIKWDQRSWSPRTCWRPQLMPSFLFMQSRLSPWTWLTCEWCVVSAGSPGPWPAHRWRASRCLPGSGHSAAGDTAGPRPAGGPPPWTYLPHPGRSTWDGIRHASSLDTCMHRRTRGKCYLTNQGRAFRG